MHLADVTSPSHMSNTPALFTVRNFDLRSVQDPSQSQGFSYTGTGARPMPMLAANYRAPSFGGSSKKNKAIAPKQTKPTKGNTVSRGGTNMLISRKTPLTSRMSFPKLERASVTKD